MILFAFMAKAWAIKTDQAIPQLSGLKEQQEIRGFRVANLYGDADGRVIGAKFVHIRTATPVFLLQIETVPKAFMWIDTPDESDRGVPHALEHLLANKGAKGRYVTLLTNMRLSQSVAATEQDFNFYSFSSGTGLDGFFEQLHAWLDCLFRADFTNAEAERELYHFGISSAGENKLTLAEAGSVYDEKQSGQSVETYYFELNKRVLGIHNPFGSDVRGVPDSMRDVSSKDIRRFYEQNYKLGPATGFIFVINPKETVLTFLERLSGEFDAFAPTGASGVTGRNADEPKYSIHSSENTSIGIYPFPSGRDTDPAVVRFGWRPGETKSPAELKLLHLFFRGLAADQRSVLYGALVDSKMREMESGAKKVEYDIFQYNSPFFPMAQIEISGIPGDRISVEQAARLRSVILGKIREISEYSDQSTKLHSFNALVSSYAKAWRRSEKIWIRTPPLFGSDLGVEWKDHFNLLEMDRSFVRSISEEPAWHAVEQQLQSGTNIWRELIAKFQLLDTPYTVASKPSAQLLAGMETAKQNRIRNKIEALRRLYQSKDDQEALAQFERNEMEKTREIDAIEKSVPRPKFTAHPPLTADDEIRYRQFRLAGVPVVASIFDRPPTVDIGLAFDLRKVPRRYYKYLPILPRCFDSVRLNKGNRVVEYPDLLAQVEEQALKFSLVYEQNAASKRADLVFRVSSSDSEGVRMALDLTSQILHFGYCDLSAVDRLRDLVARRLTIDEAFTRDEFRLMQNAAYSFLTQQDTLFQAVNSAFTRTHWDERLKWQLHKSMSATEIEHLGTFAAQVLSQSEGSSPSNISRQLARPDLSDLEREVLEYWQKNLALLPEMELTQALSQLTLEVQEDLRAGPAHAIGEIRELQKIVLDRQALHIDLVIDDASIERVKPLLLDLVNSLPTHPRDNSARNDPSVDFPVMMKLGQRYHLQNRDFPWYVGLVNSDAINGDMVFYSDLPGHAHLDRDSLIKILSSKIFAGTGPGSFYIKTREAGLSYAILLTSNPAFKLLWDYADRSPDIPALVALLNKVAENGSNLQDPLIVDYALRQTFSIPRSIYPPSTRGVAIAQDLRDGNDPETVRRFSEAILKLRQDPTLFSELTHAAAGSICGVLIDQRCKGQHKSSHSIFFFVGSEKILSDTERRLPIPKLLRVWPSDYWLE
jgi:Zn-dependent M16 (insulinase) family peptidase